MQSSNLTCIECQNDDGNNSPVYMENFCFYATLKGLKGLTSLDILLKSHYQHKDCKIDEWCITCSVHKLLRQMNLTKPTITDYTRIQQLCGDYTLHSYDAYAFLECLLSSMSKQFSSRFPISDFFDRRVKSPKELFIISVNLSYVCLSCRRQSDPYERHDLLRLEMDIDESTTIDDALHRYFTPENMDHKCECNSVKAENRLKFSKQPFVLTFVGKATQLVNIQTQFSQVITLCQCWFDDGDTDVIYRIQSIIIRERNGHHTTILYGNHTITNYYLDDGSSYVAMYELLNGNEANCAIGPDEIIGSTHYDAEEFGDQERRATSTNDSSSSSEYGKVVNLYECIKLPNEVALSIHHHNASDYISVFNSDSSTSLSSDGGVSLVESPNDSIEIMSSITYLEAIELEFQEEFNLSESSIIDNTNTELDDDGIQDCSIRTVNNLTDFDTIEESYDDSQYAEATSSESSFNCSGDSYESFAEKTDKATEIPLPPENPLDKLESDDNEKLKRPGMYVRAPTSSKRYKRDSPTIP